MVEFIKKWLLADGYERFEEARVLNNETSDPETEPYVSKYKAREIFKTLKTKIEDFVEDSGLGTKETDIRI